MCCPVCDEIMQQLCMYGDEETIFHEFYCEKCQTWLLQSFKNEARDKNESLNLLSWLV